MSRKPVKKPKLIQLEEAEKEQESSSSVSLGLITTEPLKAIHIKHPKTLMENKIRPGREKERKSGVYPLSDKLDREQLKLVEQTDLSFSDFSLSYHEEKVLHALLIILSKSDYKGNRAPNRKKSIIPGEGRDDYPVIAVSQYELVAAYTGGKSYSGSVYSTIQKTLVKFQTTLFGMLIKRRKEGKQLNSIVVTGQLLGIIGYSVEGNKKLLTIEISPLLVYNINNYFLSRPVNFYGLLEEACSSRRVPPSVSHLVEYLAAKASHKTAKGKETIKAAEKLSSLYGKIQLQRYVDRRDKKKAKEYLKKALVTCEKVGALSSYEIKRGATGELTCYFVINVKCPLW